MEAQKEKTLEQAQLLEEMSKDYWELVNQESSQMFKRPAFKWSYDSSDCITSRSKSVKRTSG